jgi:hypothetical protein
MRVGQWITAGILMAALASTVDAQPPGKGQKGKGQGGMFRGGGLDMNTLVLTNVALQEELKVSGEQKEKFKTVADKQAAAQKKMMEMFQGGGKGAKIDREKFAEMAKDREKLTEEIKTTVETTLTTDQKTRLKQIERQRDGVRAFTTDEVATALKLTDEQKNKVKGISEEMTKDLRELGGGGGFGMGNVDPEKLAEIQKKTQKVRREALEKVNEILTADQKAEWKKMSGEYFDVAKLTPQPRRKD